MGVFEGRFVTVVYTTRSEAIRIISFRRERHEERQKYQELYGGRA
ncbi:MAG: BrnT family toxin [Desulfobaccales bacterium]